MSYRFQLLLLCGSAMVVCLAGSMGCGRVGSTEVVGGDVDAEARPGADARWDGDLQRAEVAPCDGMIADGPLAEVDAGTMTGPHVQAIALGADETCAVVDGEAWCLSPWRNMPSRGYRDYQQGPRRSRSRRKVPARW